jgi:hypothetical protein
MNDLIMIPKLTEWQKLKEMVLDGVSLLITKRVYWMALDGFMQGEFPVSLRDCG